MQKRKSCWVKQIDLALHAVSHTASSDYRLDNPKTSGLQGGLALNPTLHSCLHQSSVPLGNLWIVASSELAIQRLQEALNLNFILETGPGMIWKTDATWQVLDCWFG